MMKKTITHEKPADSQTSSPSFQQRLSSRRRLTYIFILGALTALGPFTIDLYLPAFPLLEQEFDAPMAAIQLTLTGTTIGFAGGQLFMGPLSDRFGRKPLLLLSTSLHLIASLGVAAAGTLEILGLMRILQGLGASGSAVVVMAIARDLFSGQQLVIMLSRLALVTGLAPILGPFIGSQLLGVMPWHGLFLCLAIYAALLLTASMFLIRETYPKKRREEHNIKALERYRAVLFDRNFLFVCFISGLNFTGMFSYVSQSPFLFQKIYGLTVQEYGLLFAANSVGFVLGVQTSARLLRKYTQQRIMSISLSGMFVLTLFMFLGSSLLGDSGLWAFTIPLWLYLYSSGLTVPCTQTLALADHEKEAGTAASILGAANYGISGFAAPLGAILSVPLSQGPAAALLMGLCMLLALSGLTAMSKFKK